MKYWMLSPQIMESKYKMKQKYLGILLFCSILYWRGGQEVIPSQCSKATRKKGLKKKKTYWQNAQIQIFCKSDIVGS